MEVEEANTIQDGVIQFNQLKQSVIQKKEELEREVLMMMVLDN